MSREVIVKCIRSTGEITFVERVTVNKRNRITLHHGFDCLVDEGANGQPFRKIYNHVKKVVFTGRTHDGCEVVEVHMSIPLGDDEARKDFENESQKTTARCC